MAPFEIRLGDGSVAAVFDDGLDDFVSVWRERRSGVSLWGFELLIYLFSIMLENSLF